MKQADLLPFKLLPLGECAMVLQFEDQISKETNERIRAICSYFDSHQFEGLIEYVPAYTSITFYYDPWVISKKGTLNPYDRIVECLQASFRKVKKDSKLNTRVVEIPVCYGGEFGPDISEVASLNNLQTEEVIALHTKPVYLVHMIGFAPGFPYLGGLSPKLITPRKENPRKSIPKGSVGIAGSQTGVYTLDTPGGWQLIGRTPIELFNFNRDIPSLLKAGDRVKFKSITATEFERMVQREH